MTEPLAPGPPAPGEPPPDTAPAPVCPFCRLSDCEWLLSLLRDHQVGWHPRTLAGRPLPDAMQRVGEFVLMQDAVGRFRPRLLVPDAEQGAILARRLAVATNPRTAEDP